MIILDAKQASKAVMSIAARPKPENRLSSAAGVSQSGYLES